MLLRLLLYVLGCLIRILGLWSQLQQTADGEKNADIDISDLFSLKGIVWT